MTKILYSPGFGAGWSTWAGGSSEFQKWMLTYQPLIDAIERDETLLPDDLRFEDLTKYLSRLHPALQQFVREAKELFDEEVYIGGADNLCVTEINGPFRIDEYDGNESVIEASNQDWITL